MNDLMKVEAEAVVGFLKARRWRRHGNTTDGEVVLDNNGGDLQHIGSKAHFIRAKPNPLLPSMCRRRLPDLARL